MDIGALRHRLTFQYPARTGTTMNPTVTWTDACTVWGAIWPLHGTEAVAAMQMGGTITHKVRIRFRTGIRTGWRISAMGRFFNIVGPPIDMGTEHRWMEMTVKEAT